MAMFLGRPLEEFKNETAPVFGDPYFMAIYRHTVFDKFFVVSHGYIIRQGTWHECSTFVIGTFNSLGRLLNT